MLAKVAVLRIVVDEHWDRGGCDRSMDEIAARAGVCRRTVQNALRHAKRLGLVSITERRRIGARNPIGASQRMMLIAPQRWP